MKTISFTRNHFIRFFTNVCMLMTFLSTLVLVHAITLEPMTRTFEKEGGGAAILVKGSGTEKWTATSSVSWINITPTTSGTGDGIVSYIVSANRTSTQRIGVITIGGVQHTVYQNGYEAEISPKQASYDLNGGVGTIIVTANYGIAWDAKSNVSWITITSGSNGAGNGIVSYKVAGYTGSVAIRTGTLTICGKTFTITQTGEDIILSPVSANIDENSNIVLFNINALSTTFWNVKPNPEWISVLSKTNGYGDATVTLVTTANLSYDQRVGTVSVEGKMGNKIFTITQAAMQPPSQLSVSVNPKSASALSTGAYGIINVFATPRAPWKAQSTVPWLTITDGASGEGDGNIHYVVSPNTTLDQRTGEISVIFTSELAEITSPKPTNLIYCTYYPNAIGGGIRYFDRWNFKNTATQAAGGSAILDAGDSMTFNVWLKNGSAYLECFSYKPGLYSYDSRIYSCGDEEASDSWNMYTITVKPTNIKYEKYVLNKRHCADVRFSVETKAYRNGKKISDDTKKSVHACFYYNELYAWSETKAKLTYIIQSSSGYCDEIEIYSGILSDEEIKNLYEKEKYPSSRYICDFCSITQSAEDPSLNEEEKVFSADGGSGQVQLNIANGVVWSAKSNDSWIKLLSPKTDVSGSGSVSYEVAPNNSVNPRKGTLTIAGLTYTVTQGVRSHSIDNTEFIFGPDGGMGAANFVCEAGAEWEAVASDDWIKIAEGRSGTGPSGIIFILAPYTAPTRYRIGTITIGTAVITMRQYGYQSSVTPLVQEIAPNGGALTLDVTVPFGAVWDAASRANWITFVGGPDYTGSGTLTYIVAPNLTSGPRSATLYVAGKEVSITQSENIVPEKPTIITQPESQTVTEGNSVTFSVTAAGSEPLSYQWFMNSSLLDGVSGSSYTIPSVTVSDAGTYMVMVSNEQGAVMSSLATLTVKQGGVPELSLKQAGSKWKITFTGTLQESTDMKSWKNVSGTQNGAYTFTPAKGKKFYRAIQ